MIDVELFDPAKHPKDKKGRWADTPDAPTGERNLMAMGHHPTWGFLAMPPFKRAPGEIVREIEKHFSKLGNKSIKVQANRVPLDKLMAIQQFVSRKRVDEAMRGAGDPASSKLPLVVKHGGKLYIMDGHHRLSGAWLKGSKTVKVHLYSPKLRATNEDADAAEPIGEEFELRYLPLSPYIDEGSVEPLIAGVDNYNPNHQPAGDEHGGEFAPADGGDYQHPGKPDPQSGGEYIHGPDAAVRVSGLRKIEAKIADGSVEVLVGWRNGRQVLRHEGGEVGVDLTVPQAAALEGADVVTHNHPSGAGFSEDDLLLARGQRIKELRVVGRLANGSSVLYRAFVSKAPRGRLEQSLIRRHAKVPHTASGIQAESHYDNVRWAKKAGYEYERYINGRLAMRG